MNPHLRLNAKWSIRVFLVLLALGAVYVLTVTLPGPLFAHKANIGAYRVYSDEPLPDDFERVIDDLDARLRGMEHAPPAARQRIYLCGPGKFRFFAFLLRMNPQSLAIGLSVANETFVSTARVRAFAEANRGRLRHTRYEGHLAEVVAHEVAHFNSVRALGFRAHLRQPVWKSEGWAEYQANLTAIRADPGYDLVARIEVLRDDAYWGDRHGSARFLWESQLLVEYLGEVEGYDLTRLVRVEVTESSARRRMMAWYRARTD